MKIEILVEICVSALCVLQVVRWVRMSRVTANPWSQEVEDAVQQEDAVAICHRCLTPQEAGGWFCPHCNAATGPYNNYLPYINQFSYGEVLRIGTAERFRPTPMVVAGFLLFSLANYLIFAPVYWYYFFKNLKRQESDKAPETDEQTTP